MSDGAREHKVPAAVAPGRGERLVGLDGLAIRHA